MSSTKSAGYIRIQCDEAMKQQIAAAAQIMGQSIQDFVIDTLTETAAAVIAEVNTTRLSARDQKRVLAMLADETSEPNAALRKAAERYKKNMQ